MTEELATVRIRARGAIVMATVEGELDVSNTGGLLEELTRAVQNSTEALLLDLADLEFLDSSGVHMLYDIAERLANRQQRFAVVVPAGSPPRRTIELSGVEPARWLHDDQASALAALGG